MRTWRAAVVVVVMALAAGACGASGSSSGGAKDAAGRPRLPVGAGATGAGNGARATKELSAPVAGDAAATSFAPARFVEYRLADAAKAPATKAPAYRVVPGDKENAAADVAKALDVEAAKVEVQQGIGWYYSGSGDGSVSSGVAVACSSDGKCPEPVRPPPPPGVPTPAEAEKRFRAMLDALGTDTKSGTFEVQPDLTDIRQVTFRPSVKGVEVEGFESSIAFGENGRIEYANGFLGTFDQVGEYPLVDLAAALKRHEEGFGGGIRTMGAAEGAPTAVDAAAPQRGGASAGGTPTDPPLDPGCAKGETCTAPPSPPAPAPDDEPTVTIEPQPTDPTVPLEPEIIEITGAELVLQVVYGTCPGDTIYLVPSFRLLPVETAGFSVPAVEDASLAGANPDPKKPAEPCAGQTEPDAPVGKPEPAPLPPDRGAVEPAPAPLPPEPAKP